MGARNSPKRAVIFKSYYSQLCNLAQPASGVDSAQRLTIIIQYLQKSQMPSLLDEVIQELEKPILIVEFTQTIKSMKPGKAPDLMTTP